MIVLKFGGTSLESPEAIERVARIVRSRIPRHPAVVVSAHAKTTDDLGTKVVARRAARSRSAVQDSLLLATAVENGGGVER